MSNTSANQNNIKYYVGFSLMHKIGSTRFKKLENYFSSMSHAWQASYSELCAAGFDSNLAQEIIIRRDEINLNQAMRDLAQEKISVINWHDEKYPKLLKQIYDPPAILYYQGEFNSAEDEFSLAVVGTRQASLYGQQITPDITRQLVQVGMAIVSGLALGVDSLAHETCLKNNGRTIAVLGSGLDRQSIYPSYNRYLVDKIIKSGGLILSEYPIGTAPLKHNFPQRNRIVSGLSKGVLIIEAPESSGALLTAKNALDQNREVFAIPGSVYNSKSIGPNNLIKQGAKLVSSAEDILEALDLQLVKDYVASKKIIPDSPQEEKILQHLSHEPLHVDQLTRLTKLDTQTINSTLTLMEMKGMAKNLGGMRWVVS